MAAALALLFLAALVLMDSWPADPLPYRAGQFVPADIPARTTFVLPVRQRVEEATRRARGLAPGVFELDTALVSRLIDELRTLPPRIGGATQPADLPKNLRDELGATSGENLPAWKAYTQPAQKTRYEEQLERLRGDLAKIYLARMEDKAQQRARGSDYSPDPQIWLVWPGGQERKSTADLLVPDEGAKVQQELGKILQGFDEPIRNHVRAVLLGQLARQPLYVFNAEKTGKAIEEAIRSIQTEPSEIHPAGQVLVPRTLGLDPPRGLQEPELALLAAEQAAYVAAERKEAPWRPWLRRGGRWGILLLIVVLAGGYTWRYRPEVKGRPLRGLCLVLVLAALLGLAKVLCQGLGLHPASACLPVLVGAFVLTVAYDARFALAMGGIVSVLAVFLLRADLGLLLVLAAGLTVVVGFLREIRTRTKVIAVSAGAGAAALAASWAEGLAAGVPFWPFAAMGGAWGAGSAVLAGFFVQGILPLVERVFGVATSMTLLEWCDADRPLLRRLRNEAPGTYNHSLQLGALCEAAAEAIGARGLLARAGAYYHDIGKISKPDYFVENQVGPSSRHDRLSPAMSLLVITGHVKDGLELAQEYGLPALLHEFIATHHGTTLVQYFYRAEAERRKAEEERAPDEVEFRYPGPKPRSKEAAILMLADAAETSVRSMPEPSPGRIENQVHALLTRRLMDGQLDDCDLTLREISRIEESFVRNLCSMYHSRPAYPTPAGEQPSAAELPPAPAAPAPPTPPTTPAPTTSEGEKSP